MSDGVTHINVYSQGATELGRFLSNFTPCKILTPEGEFSSVEGYWYYLNSPDTPAREKLKSATGFAVKKLGRDLKAKDWNNDPLFQTKIKFAIFQKLIGNPERFSELRGLKLPLRHYYVYNGKAVEPKDGKWILEFLAAFQSL